MFRRTMSCYIISNDILLSEPEFKNILDCGDYMISIPKGYDTGVSRGSVGCPLIDAFRLRSRGFVGFCRITPVQNEASMRHMLM